MDAWSFQEKKQGGQSLTEGPQLISMQQHNRGAVARRAALEASAARGGSSGGPKGQQQATSYHAANGSYSFCGKNGCLEWKSFAKFTSAYCTCGCRWGRPQLLAAAKAGAEFPGVPVWHGGSSVPDGWNASPAPWKAESLAEKASKHPGGSLSPPQPRRRQLPAHLNGGVSPAPEEEEKGCLSQLLQALAMVVQGAKDGKILLPVDLPHDKLEGLVLNVPTTPIEEVDMEAEPAEPALEQVLKESKNAYIAANTKWQKCQRKKSEAWEAAEEIRARLADAELRAHEAAIRADAADQLLEEAGQKVADAQARLKLSRSQAAATKDLLEKEDQEKGRARGSEGGEEDELHFEAHLKQSLRAAVAKAAMGGEAAGTRAEFLASCQQQFELLWQSKAQASPPLSEAPAQARSPPRGPGPNHRGPEEGRNQGGGASVPLPGTPPSCNPAESRKERVQSRSPRRSAREDEEGL